MLFICPFCKTTDERGPNIREGHVVQCLSCGERSRFPGHATVERASLPEAEDYYRLELPGDSVEIMALDDAEAQTKAREYLRTHDLVPVNSKLHLYRYPKEWVTKGGSLIEVPFML